MIGRKSGKMSDQSQLYQLIYDCDTRSMSDPVENPDKSTDLVAGSQSTASNRRDSLVDPDPLKIPDTVPPSKAAELLSVSIATVKRHCADGKYPGARKVLVDGVEAWQIPVESLPKLAQSKLLKEVKAAMRARAAAQGLPIPDEEKPRLSPAEYSLIWKAYESTGGKHKSRAEAALEALHTFKNAVDSGLPMGDAEKLVWTRHKVSHATLWRYRKATEGHPVMHWLPLLGPRYKGGRPPVEFTEAAYEHIRSRVLTTSAQPLTAIVQEAREMAAANGWVIPSIDAVRDRLKKEPRWAYILGQEGPSALERSYPAVHRSYGELALHQVWESDGRKVDVMCRWPDGTIARPYLVVWRELRTRMVLSVKGYVSENSAIVLASFGAAMALTGVAPDLAKIDNGRAYASKSVTGGQSNRYRWTVVPGEQPGVMTLVGTKAWWSAPGRGQDKPVESFWGFFADYVDKHKAFEGAYVGNSPVAKPEDYARENAAPIEVYERHAVRFFEWFNTQHRHTGDGMNGRTARDVYEELAKQTEREPVDPAHIRLCYAGRAEVKPNKVDATYTFKIPGFGVCRYWSEKIAGLPKETLSRKHAVYYDINDPYRPVQVYDGNCWLGDAGMLESLPFIDAKDAAAAHVKGKNHFLSSQKQAVEQMKGQGVPALPAPDGATGRELPPIPGFSIVGKGRPQLEAVDRKPRLTEEDERELARLEEAQKEKRRRANPALYRKLGT